MGRKVCGNKDSSKQIGTDSGPRHQSQSTGVHGDSVVPVEVWNREWNETTLQDTGQRGTLEGLLSPP